MSFVGADGADTNVQATHSFRWFRLENNQQAARLRAWQPWIRTNDLNGVAVFWYQDAMALWSHVQELHADVDALSLIQNPSGAIALVRAILVLLATTTVTVTTKAGMAVDLDRVSRGFTAEQRAAVTLRQADTVARLTPGVPAYQIAISYGAVKASGGPKEALHNYFYYSGDQLLAPPAGGLPLTVPPRPSSLARRSELLGRQSSGG